MESTSKERKSADIQATAHLHKDVARQLLTDHAICRGADNLPTNLYETSVPALDETQRTVQLASTIGWNKTRSTL